MKASLLLIGLLSAGVAFANPPAPKKEGIESKNYKWNAEGGEKMEALHKKGNVKNGEEVYEICGACHLPSGAGRADGTFPQLAGQHSTVLIKQMA
ncbi:MAG: c-type cytochrome, partial [Azonexus sp.]